jgi:uncharacterized protein Usg
MDDKAKKLRIKELDGIINNLTLNIENMKRKIRELSDKKHQLVTEEVMTDEVIPETVSISENHNQLRQEYLRQKNLINSKIQSLKKNLKDLDVQFWKKELDYKIKNISENHSNLVTLDEFKSIRRRNSQ